MVEVHKRVGRPDLLPQLFPRHHVAGTLQQNRQNLEGPLLELDLSSVLMELAGAEICPEVGKLDHLRLRSGPNHGRAPTIWCLIVYHRFTTPKKYVLPLGLSSL